MSSFRLINLLLLLLIIAPNARAIYKYAHGKINNDNLRVFFRNFDFSMNIEEEDIENWIRKYDRDVDFQLDYSDFVTSISP